MIRRYLVRELTNHKNAPRIYLDIAILSEAGFGPGVTYTRELDPEKKRVILRVDPKGTYRVSRKEVRGNTVPVIDINSNAGLEPLEGLKAVRLVIQDKLICAMPLASEVNVRARLQRLRDSIARGELVTASLSHGGGILDHAAHQGLNEVGLEPRLAMANEIDCDLLEHASTHNEVWRSTTLGVGAPMQEAVQDEWLMGRMPKVDVLAVGIPCSGASRAGVSKRGLEMMEAHPQVGHLVASFLMVVQRTQPAIVVVECVKEYQKSASAQIMRQHLRDSGYGVREVLLDGKSFGVLEGRTRWFLVAATTGINIDLDSLEPTCVPVRTSAEVLENVSDDDPAWRSFDYLKVKEVRDAAKGNGFAMQIVHPDDTSVPVLRKGYHKGGSTDPLLAHPTRAGIYRLFTAVEHARIKQIAEHLISDMSQTKAHELLGQSVLVAPVKALFNRIGHAVRNWAREPELGREVPQHSPAYQLALATG